jgi:hypothetical protein
MEQYPVEYAILRPGGKGLQIRRFSVPCIILRTPDYVRDPHLLPDLAGWNAEGRVTEKGLKDAVAFAKGLPLNFRPDIVVRSSLIRTVDTLDAIFSVLGATRAELPTYQIVRAFADENVDPRRLANDIHAFARGNSMHSNAEINAAYPHLCRGVAENAMQELQLLVIRIAIETGRVPEGLLAVGHNPCLSTMRSIIFDLPYREVEECAGFLAHLEIDLDAAPFGTFHGMRELPAPAVSAEAA